MAPAIFALEPRRALLLLVSSLATLIGCSIVWHELLELETMNYRSCHSFFIFGYVQLACSHWFTANALVKGDKTLGYLHSFNTGIVFMVMVGFSSDSMDMTPTTLLYANTLRVKGFASWEDKKYFIGLIFNFIGALLGVLATLPFPTSLSETKIIGLTVAAFLGVAVGSIIVWNVEVQAPAPVPALEQLADKVRNGVAQFAIQASAIIVVLGLGIACKCRDLIHSTALFLGIFGFFSLGILFYLQYGGSGKNPAAPYQTISDSEAEKLWAGGVLVWLGMATAFVASLLFIQGEQSADSAAGPVSVKTSLLHNPGSSKV